MTRNVVTVILLLVFLVGLSLLLYPTIADYWNNNIATHAVVVYNETIQSLDDKQYEEEWNRAVQYNADLNERESPFRLDETMKQRYWENLNLQDNGIMGYIEIPKIDVNLPVYHGTADDILQIGIGHIDWTSIPTGGESTHCVLSGHRGLLSAKLFTDLDKLYEGDQFVLNVMNETLTYEVDQIRTVLPQDVKELCVSVGMDYCTLVTCTPYGINTHRLLVRGHRIESAEAAAKVVSEAVIVEPMVVAPIVAIPLFMIFVISVFTHKPKRKFDPKKYINGEIEVSTK